MWVLKEINFRNATEVLKPNMDLSRDLETLPSIFWEDRTDPVEL